MKKLLLVLTLAFIPGCSVTLEEVDKAKLRCTAAQGTPHILVNQWDGSVVGISCHIDGISYRVNKNGAFTDGSIVK